MKNLWIVLALALAACSHAEPKKSVARKAAPGTSIEAKQLAAEEQAAYLAELTFPKDSADLPAREKQRLVKVLEEAKGAGSIDEIKVISWADAEYPSVHTGRLSDTDRGLAEQRNDRIREYLKAWDQTVAVDTFNMAVRPGPASRLFAAEDARIKKTLEVAGIPNTDTTVKKPAKASKAIVLVRLKEEGR